MRWRRHSAQHVGHRAAGDLFFYEPDSTAKGIITIGANVARLHATFLPRGTVTGPPPPDDATSPTTYTVFARHLGNLEKIHSAGPEEAVRLARAVLECVESIPKSHGH